MAVKVTFADTTFEDNDISKIPLQDGRFLFTTDLGSLYRDTSEQRFLIAGPPEVGVYVRGSTLHIDSPATFNDGLVWGDIPPAAPAVG